MLCVSAPLSRMLRAVVRWWCAWLRGAIARWYCGAIGEVLTLALAFAYILVRRVSFVRYRVNRRAWRAPGGVCEKGKGPE